MGKAFHNLGAATEKGLSPKDVNIFPRGKSSSNPSFDITNMGRAELKVAFSFLLIKFLYQDITTSP